MGILPHREPNPNIAQHIAQASGCYSSAWAMLAAEFGDIEATKKLETECGFDLPMEIINEGMKKKARFAHIRKSQ